MGRGFQLGVWSVSHAEVLKRNPKANLAVFSTKDLFRRILACGTRNADPSRARKVFHGVIVYHPSCVGCMKGFRVTHKPSMRCLHHANHHEQVAVPWPEELHTAISQHVSPS